MQTDERGTRGFRMARPMSANDDKQHRDSLGEWMKVMLEEIERKESEHAEAREELRRRGRSDGEAAGKDDASIDAHG